MHFNDHLDDAQPDAGPRDARRRLGAVEAREDAADIVLVDADAVILHLDPDLIAFEVAGGADAARIVAEKLAVVGKRIDSAATAYNDVVGSFETRFMVTTRKLEDLGARSNRELKSVPAVKLIEAVTSIQSRQDASAMAPVT